MWKFVAIAKRVLWEFVELGFLTVLALILIFLLLGQNAGPYVASVADNVTKFATTASSGLLEMCIRDRASVRAIVADLHLRVLASFIWNRSGLRAMTHVVPETDCPCRS